MHEIGMIGVWLLFGGFGLVAVGLVLITAASVYS